MRLVYGRKIWYRLRLLLRSKIGLRGLWKRQLSVGVRVWWSEGLLKRREWWKGRSPLLKILWVLVQRSPGKAGEHPLLSRYRIGERVWLRNSRRILIWRSRPRVAIMALVIVGREVCHCWCRSHLSSPVARNGAASSKATAVNHGDISLYYINQGIDAEQSTNARSYDAMSTRDNGDVYDEVGGCRDPTTLG